MASPTTTRCSRFARSPGTASASCSTSIRGRSTRRWRKPASDGTSHTATCSSSRRRNGPTTSAPSTAAELVPAKGFKANLREDTGEVLGIVSDEYEVVDNRDAFRFLDALIGSDMHFETAGSLWGGRRVWCLARLPEYVELGGDLSATYIYVANSHDGSMAVTAAVTPIRIVCANTLGAALRHAEHGVARAADVPLPAHRQPAVQVRRGAPSARDDDRLPAAVQSARRPARARADQRAGARASASCGTCG